MVEGYHFLERGTVNEAESMAAQKLSLAVILVAIRACSVGGNGGMTVDVHACPDNSTNVFQGSMNNSLSGARASSTPIEQQNGVFKTCVQLATVNAPRVATTWDPTSIRQLLYASILLSNVQVKMTRCKKQFYCRYHFFTHLMIIMI